MKNERNKFNVMCNIGKCKYVVNYHTVGKYHQDGSEFYNIHITNNKRDLNRFLKSLKANGYIEVGYLG